MTEFETLLLSMLRDIRDELQVSSVPEDLRRNQREVIAISKQQEMYDILTENNEQHISEYLDELIKQYPDKEYDELLTVDEKLKRLDQRNKDIEAKWQENEQRLEKLCKKGCFHPEYIYKL